MLLLMFLVIVGVFAYNFSTDPQIDSNPIVTPEDILGTWRDQDGHRLTLTPDEYWFGDSKADSGTWRLDDWNLMLSKDGLYRVIDVGGRLEIIHGSKGGELTYYPSFVRIDSR